MMMLLAGRVVIDSMGESSIEMPQAMVDYVAGNALHAAHLSLRGALAMQQSPT
jgi:hypothetical protein